jgi:hypothetical protein
VEKFSTAGEATDGDITRRMRCACWITKAVDTRSECVIIVAFPRQQWLRKSPLFYTDIARLVMYAIFSLLMFGHSVNASGPCYEADCFTFAASKGV